jgi:hypothetical protein
MNEDQREIKRKKRDQLPMKRSDQRRVLGLDES